MSISGTTFTTVHKLSIDIFVTVWPKKKKLRCPEWKLLDPTGNFYILTVNSSCKLKEVKAI